MNKNFPNLRSYREALGLTQKDLRLMLGYSECHYQAVETGKNNNKRLINKARELFQNILENKKCS